MLVKNLTEQGGPGKLRPYWEQQIYVVTQKRKDMPVYKVRPQEIPKNGEGWSRVLHCNLLLPYSYLAGEIQTKARKSIKTGQQGPRQVTKQQTPGGEPPGSTDEDMQGLTLHQLKEFCESTNTEIIDGHGTAPESAEQEVNPLPIGDLNGSGRHCEPVDTLNDDHVPDAEPLRQSERTTRPPLRMTFDALGQPSFQPWATPGVQAVSASCL